MHRVGQAQLLERDGDFAAVRRRPGVEIDHDRGPVLVGN
jgi:hypothetical protein